MTTWETITHTYKTHGFEDPVIRHSWAKLDTAQTYQEFVLRVFPGWTVQIREVEWTKD